MPSAGWTSTPCSASCVATSAGVTSSSFARTALSAGLLSRSSSATVSSGPNASHHMRITHSGCEWRTAASAGLLSVSCAIRSLASRVARRMTALTRRWPPRPCCFASSTVCATAAWSGTLSRRVTWYTPRRRALSSGGSIVSAVRDESPAMT